MSSESGSAVQASPLLPSAFCLLPSKAFCLLPPSDLREALPKSRLVDPTPLRPILRLVIRPRRVARAGDTRLRAEEVGEHRRGDLEVLLVIRHVDPRPSRGEHPCHLPQDVGPDDAPLLV